MYTDIARIYQALDELQKVFEGDIFTDETTRLLYATDASAYREMPMAVCVPRYKLDLLRIIEFANRFHVPLIPRTAGTSLAGQVVGNGIVVDVSKNFKRIIELNEKEHWVRVEAGVVLDELNKYLAPKGLYFGPETSTSNRCMIGGMLGNNSCGAHSLVYGSMRDQTISVRAYLSNGSEVEFADLTQAEFEATVKCESFGSRCYGQINELLG